MALYDSLRLARFGSALASTNDIQSLSLDLDELRSNLKKPLRPFWVTRGSPVPPFEAAVHGLDYYPVILCTASRQVPGGEARDQGYVQGAADDSESWAHGLTAALFWNHKDKLLQTPEDDLPDAITALIQDSKPSGTAKCTLIKPTQQLYIGTNNAVDAITTDWSIIISCSPEPDEAVPLVSNDKAGSKSNVVAPNIPRHIHIPCASGKLGSRQLRHNLTQILPALDSIRSSSAEAETRILITCPTGKDHSIGVALAILCLYFDESGHFRPRHSASSGQERIVIDKQFIRKRLSWIMVSVPYASPSRATLQSVNAFLYEV